MLKTKRIYGILLAVLILTVTSALNIDSSFSQETPLVYVDPPSITGLSISETFTIDVIIANITNFYGIDLQFGWDPAILEYVSHTMTIPADDYPSGILWEPGIKIKDEVNATAGTYWVAYASMDPAPVFDGTGKVFNMTFKVIGIGTCLLEAYLTYLSDKPGDPINHNKQNGYFSNYAPSEARIYVNPEKIVDSTLEPCKNFTIDINLEEIVELESFEFQLSYNTTILDTVNVTVNPPFSPPTEIQITEPEGQIRVAATASTPVSGSLIISSITFHVTEVGGTILNLHNITLIDTWNGTVPYEDPGDGYFNNILVTKLYVDPPTIIDPTLKPGDQFHIDIKVENAIDFYGYDLSLAYDTDIITCLGAITIPPDNDTNFILKMSINDEAGNIWINVTYHSPATPKTILIPTTIATIYFQVQTYGSTELDLHNTKIINQYGGAMSHEVGDGFFCTLIRDVAIVDVRTSRNATYPGRLVNVTVVAANLGDMIETFNVTAYYDSNEIGTQTVFNLAPHRNTTLTFTWNTTGLQPCNNYTIKAEAWQVPYEINIENNIYTDGFVKIKMIGDVNGDGIIDIYDLTAACGAYGSREGDPNWNPEVDLAPIWGIIEIYDLVTIASRYGQTCP
ncbi:MAG: cohesin domain-containing protein [Candidatus Bathyarchaeota archaeon]|nr:cohesin domain-containing protein [Candidatus Bathyarchaeota archaeon]MDH5494585.1 cohesin domain-containing protein [Candidatus Bathyarchaeota archaeon]